MNKEHLAFLNQLLTKKGLELPHVSNTLQLAICIRNFPPKLDTYKLYSIKRSYKPEAAKAVADVQDEIVTKSVEDSSFGADFAPYVALTTELTSGDPFPLLKDLKSLTDTNHKVTVAPLAGQVLLVVTTSSLNPYTYPNLDNINATADRLRKKHAEPALRVVAVCKLSLIHI
eukprot:TRINITY_DN25569_c0_g1_i2.p1 TRINITY_DN25569_c0_g1~~TRINITY_DN25569_c0_g1_i2.p1  ORF type:complete len:172 (-),score=29.80 TRINITY_DN25569_c0_g1_i2:57-572(-)